MTKVLDGYLIGRATVGAEEDGKHHLYRHLGRIAALDGYLIGRQVTP